MSPEQRNAASAGWQADRAAVGNYNQAFLEKARQDYLASLQGGGVAGAGPNIDVGIPQGPGVGGAPAGGPPAGVPPPPGGADAGFNRTGPLGLGLGLNAKNRAAFQQAAAGGTGQEWLEQNRPRVAARVEAGKAGKVQQFIESGGVRPYNQAQARNKNRR